MGGTKDQIDTATSDLELIYLRRQIELKDKEIALKSKELSDLESRKTFKVDPVVVGIFAALAGFLGNVFATYLQGRSSLELERTKFRSSLIIEAIKTGDPVKAAKNIEFFIKAGFIADEAGKISAYIAERPNVPVLPSSGTKDQAPSGTPVAGLPTDHVAHKAAAAIGLLEANGQGLCTAWLVARDLALTADYCVQSEFIGASKLTLRLGYVSAQGDPKRYDVSSPPIEVSKAYGFALLKIVGDPGKDFAPLKLKPRAPVVGERLMVLHHSGAKPVAITQNERCVVVVSSKAQPNAFEHTCDTLLGSGGAPVMSLQDQTVLGLHHSGLDDGSWNLARRIDKILEASAVLRNVARSDVPAR